MNEPVDLMAELEKSVARARKIRHSMMTPYELVAAVGEHPAGTIVYGYWGREKPAYDGTSNTVHVSLEEGTPPIFEVEPTNLRPLR